MVKLTNGCDLLYTRLPTNLIPDHYYITIRPDLDNFTFSGSETINVNVREKTKTIVLNAVDIDILLASFVTQSSQGQTEHNSIDIEINRLEEVAIIKFEDEIEVGSGQLKLQFTGVINDLMHGCYRSKYTTNEGEERYGLATHFESVYSRCAFPAFDEPSLKAKFNITLVIPKDRIGLSNTDIIEETEDTIDKNKKVLKFATTPVMSTYLIAYVVGEYEFIESKTKNNTRTRVYTLPGKTDQGVFALDVAVRCLNFYEEYFKINYPLSKIDLIALADFKISGMENWGLITYRQITLLFDPLNSSTLAKRRISEVICHELAHMWFGNLVTMKWWQDLWLKEGFATFLAYLAIDNIFPEFDVWQEFVNDNISLALQLDGMHNSHPIEIPVYQAKDIEEIFDIITYKKGASIIRMLYNHMGNDDFQKGLHNYLVKFSYKNATTQDLWDQLEEQSEKPIGSIMSTWTRQMGYPLITVKSNQTGSNRVISLHQQKFSNDGLLNEDEKNLKWMIPVSLVSQKNSKPIKLLLEDREQEVIMENIQSNEWIKINPDLTAFYRVHYSTDMIKQLEPSIIDKTLNQIDRLTILSDMFQLVVAGKISSDQVLKLIESYVNEDKFAVWNSIISCLNKFETILEYTNFHEEFCIWVRKLLAKIYSILGSRPVQDENSQISLLRSQVMSLLISVKDPLVLKEARVQFEEHVSKLKSISPDLRSSVYRAIANDQCPKTYEKLYQLYSDTDLNEEKNRIAQSMGSTIYQDRIVRSIEFAMSDEVRKQDAVYVLVAIAMSNKIARQIVWSYFKANHNKFIQNYGAGLLLVPFVKFLPAGFASEEMLQEVAEFFNSNPLPNTDRTVKQTLEKIKSNSDWLARDAQIIKNYLKNICNIQINSPE